MLLQVSSREVYDFSGVQRLLLILIEPDKPQNEIWQGG